MKRFAAVLALGLLTLMPQAVLASNELAGKLDRLAGEIAKLLEEERAGAVSVGDFTGPGQLETNAGPGIQNTLIQALKAKKIAVKVGAPLSVKGEYELVKDKSDKDRDRRVIRLTAFVRDDAGDEKLRFEEFVRGNADIAKLVAPTVNLEHKVKADAGDRNEDLNKQIRNPVTALTGTKIKAGPEGKYAIEILRGGKPLPVQVKNGNAFVALRKGDLYTIRVHNPTHLEAAVSVTIDGLDVFTFSQFKGKDNKPRFTHFTMGSERDRVIHGWHNTNEKAFAFQVGELKDSAVAKTIKDAALLRGNKKLGTITVCFHLAWEGAMPEEEKEARDAGLATGLGPPVDVKLKETKRSIGVLREVISVRYVK